MLRPWVTNSFPTLILGFKKFLYSSGPSTPIRLATRSPSCAEEYIIIVLIYHKLHCQSCENKLYLRSISFCLFFPSSLFELHFSHMHYCGSDFKHIILLGLSKSQNIESRLQQKRKFKVKVYNVYRVLSLRCNLTSVNCISSPSSTFGMVVFPWDTKW